MTEEERDEELGRALHGLDVPEHREGFWNRLEARLDEERAADPRRFDRGRQVSAVVAFLARWGPLLVAVLAVLIVLIAVL